MVHSRFGGCETNVASGPLPATARRRSTVLVADADACVRDSLSAALVHGGFTVHTAISGPTALHCAREVQPDAAILEVALDGFDGFELLRRLRDDGVSAPGLYLTDRITLQDKLTGLTLGADDYITKPFNPDEVVARLRAVLRRYQGDDPTTPGTQISCADLTLNNDSHEVFKAGKAIALTNTQFETLRYLLINVGIVLSKRRILEHVWCKAHADGNVVESCISQLRRKVDTGESRLIHTVRGFGYVVRERRAPPTRYALEEH